MEKIKSYFRMKYEMLLINTFDHILKLMKNTRVYWYPDYALGVDSYKEKNDNLWNIIQDQERYISQLAYWMSCQDDKIQHLKKQLEKYEKYEDF